MQKNTTMMRVEKEDLARFKKLAYKNGMSMIDFFNHVVKEYENISVNRDVDTSSF